MSLFESCNLCARRCGINRTKGEKGFCQAGNQLKVSSSTLHFGEEPFISGENGSGTIFFSGCSLRCLYCQNYQISQEGLGDIITTSELAQKMIDLQRKGAQNINLVSPTHFIPLIIEALKEAKEKGQKLPVVYNTSGYETLEALEALEGWVDIYLPDIKYSSDALADKYSSAPRYVEANRAAIFEMFRQVGNLELENGIAKRGLMLRHLVLPNDLAGSFDSLKFLASISKEIWVGIMSQYSPCYKAKDDPLLNRRITAEEYQAVIDFAKTLGLSNLLVQELESSENCLPDFKQEKPFAF